MVSLTGCLHCSFNHCNNNNNNNNNNSPPCAHDYREEEKITTTSSDNNEEQQQQQQQQVLLTMQITNLSTDDEAQRIVVQRQETVALSSLVSEKPFPFVWIPTRQRTTMTVYRCNPIVCTVSVPRCIVSIPTNLSTRQIPFIPFGAMVCIMLTYILWADNNKTMCV